jgi:hypothetical protein
MRAPLLSPVPKPCTQKLLCSLAWAVSSAIGVLGCNSTGVGNPGAMTVTVRNDLEAEPQATDTVQLTTAQLRHAVVAFSELRFLPCDPSMEPVIAPGPFVVDLVTQKETPEFPQVSFPPGGFCGLDAPLTSLAADASLFGNSILFSGVRSDGAVFILYAAMRGTLHIRPAADVTAWTKDNAKDVIWAVRPLRWLTPAELDAENAEPFGSRQLIVIDVNRHPLLYGAIRDRIGARATMHTDLNANGILDLDERNNALIGAGLPSLD